jgi:hypothetical protein
VGSWRRFWRLPQREKSCFLKAVALLPLTALGLRGLGLRRWQAFLERVLPAAPAALPFDPERAHATARMVAAASRRTLFRPNCLHRSLVLWSLLRGQGFDPRICFGARKEHEQFQAHAWVEVGGLSFDLSDAHLQQFVPFDRPAVSGERNPR